VRASEITAAIRQQRSERKLGFSVPVRVTLNGVDRGVWPSIARDLLEGNNVVGDPLIDFDAPALTAAIEPVAADV